MRKSTNYRKNTTFYSLSTFHKKSRQKFDTILTKVCQNLTQFYQNLISKKALFETQKEKVLTKDMISKVVDDVEKKAFYSSEKRKSFGIDQKGKYHDRHHQSNENSKADKENR